MPRRGRAEAVGAELGADGLVCVCLGIAGGCGRAGSGLWIWGWVAWWGGWLGGEWGELEDGFLMIVLSGLTTCLSACLLACSVDVDVNVTFHESQSPSPSQPPRVPAQPALGLFPVSRLLIPGWDIRVNGLNVFWISGKTNFLALAVHHIS